MIYLYVPWSSKGWVDANKTSFIAIILEKLNAQYTTQISEKGFLNGKSVDLLRDFLCLQPGDLVFTLNPHDTQEFRRYCNNASSIIVITLFIPLGYPLFHNFRTLRPKYLYQPTHRFIGCAFDHFSMFASSQIEKGLTLYRFLTKQSDINNKTDEQENINPEDDYIENIQDIETC